jgi:hypothetical protein
MKKAFALFLLALLFSGCAIGRKVNYEGRSNFNVPPESQKVIVAVHDLRPYIQNNEKSPEYVGIQQSIAGVPYNVSTKSGKPLADDFGMMIVNTLNYGKVSATQREIPHLWTFADVKEKVLGKEKDSKVYYIKMLEWRTITHFRVELNYDLQLLVFDDQANEVSNNEEKGSFYLDEKVSGKENLANATAGILGRLFAVKESHKSTGGQR